MPISIFRFAHYEALFHMATLQTAAVLQDQFAKAGKGGSQSCQSWIFRVFTKQHNRFVASQLALFFFTVRRMRGHQYC